MALTPQDVRNKQFTTVRFKEGYDLDEVDNFLDEIEVALSAAILEADDLRAVAKGTVPESIREELRATGDENTRLISELDQVRKQLEDAQARREVSGNSDDSTEALRVSHVRVNELVTELASARNEANVAADKIAELTQLVAALQSEQADGIAAAVAVAATPGEQGVASVRILELAQRTADEAISAARIEAEQLLSSAKLSSEEFVSEAKTNVATLTRELESKRVSVERRVEELRAYEREYRGRLRSYLEGQLRELDSNLISGDRQVTDN